jgi:transposase-like protein
MEDKITIGLLQLFQMFPDQDSAREYLESRLWPTGVRCPVCAGQGNIKKRKNGYYRCNPCKEDFTVRTGTIFERSHVPLHKWLYAMYLLVTARKGISSLQLSKEIDVTQKTAWFMLQRLREVAVMIKILKALDQIADVVLRYKPKPKSDSAKKRAKKKKNITGS